MHRMWARIAIALGQGAALWWLYWSEENGRWPGTDLGWLVGLAAPAVLVPLAYYLIEDLAPGRRARLVLPPLALALFGFGWHHGAWTAAEPYDDAFLFILPLAVLVFHALPFVQCWLATGRAKPAYHDLFQFAWRNALLLGFGGLFTGVLWLLLWLWGALFRMIRIEFFSDLFTEAYFAIPATAVAAGVGMQLAGSVERLQSLLRSQLLTMLKWLAPLAILILALFTVTLLVKSPELLLEQRRVISAAWLLWLVALTVALLNAAYQDGSAEAPYPGWLGRAIRVVVPLLTVVAVLAGYAVAVRVQSYGLTVARTWALLVAAIALAYAAGYTYAALRGRAWMADMGRVNVWIALGTVTMLSLMLSPALSPERLAAASQESRVLTAKNRQARATANWESDAYGYLRFDSGRYGRQRLKRLAEIQDHADAAAIRDAAAAELRRTNRYGMEDEDAPLEASRFEVFPAGRVLDPELLAAFETVDDWKYLVRMCRVADPCPVLLVDLDRDASEEALLLSRFGTLAAHRDQGRWRLRMRDSAGFAGTGKIRDALAQGRYTVRDPRYQVLEIEGHVFLMDEAREPPKSEGCDQQPATVKASPCG